MVLVSHVNYDLLPGGNQDLKSHNVSKQEKGNSGGWLHKVTLIWFNLSRYVLWIIIPDCLLNVKYKLHINHEKQIEYSFFTMQY